MPHALRPQLRARDIGIFVSCFLLSFVVQSWMAFSSGIPDEGIWGREIENTANHFLRPQDTSLGGANSAIIDPAFLYPGTTLIVPAAVLVRAGVGADVAFKLTLAFVISLFSAAAVALSARIRPKSVWWVLVGILLIFNPYYTIASPASAAVIPILAFFALVLLAFCEHPLGEGRSTRFLIAIGILGGIASATRLDVSALVFGGGLVLLSLSLGWRVIIPALVIPLTFMVLDPFSWASPLGYAGSLYESMHTLQTNPFQHMGTLELASVTLGRAPIAPLSFLLWLFVISFRPHLSPAPSALVWWLILLTATMLAIFFASPFRQIWYLYPFFVLWEMLFPLLVLVCIDALQTQKGYLSIRRSWAIASVVVLLSLCYLIPFGIGAYHILV